MILLLVFNCEYVKLVFCVSDRSARLKEMQERQEELQLNNKRLKQEEQHLREKYHEVTKFKY